MPELPEALKKYLPASLSLVLGAVWVIAEKPVTEFVQEQIKPIPARIRVENKKNNLYVVHVEITRDSDKVFEEVQIGLQLRAKPANLKAELLALDGTHPAVTVVPTNNEGKTFFVDRLTGKNPPMTLRQRESIEISFEEASPDPVSEVWLQSKDRRPIALSDPNQRWEQVSFADNQVRLDPGTTKNDEPRVIPLAGELRAILEMQLSRRNLECPDCPFVFFHRGKRIGVFLKAWRSACIRVGLGQLLCAHCSRPAKRKEGCPPLFEAGDAKEAKLCGSDLSRSPTDWSPQPGAGWCP